MEWIVALVIVSVAVGLMLVQSSWLVDYAIFVLAFNRGLRRIVDYYFNGAFNPISPISLTPLVVSGLLLVPALAYFGRLSNRARTPFILLAIALVHGFTVGFLLNRFAAVYSLAEWVSALAAMAFAATRPVAVTVADRWIKSAGWTAVGVALYGWWQYFTIPPWDAMWLVQSGMVGYMGLPEPTLMTMFSTMNERGPCGTFMAWAVIPMILNARWRNAGGWISITLLLSAIFLTGTRSNFVVIAVVAFLYPALNKGRGLLGIVLASALFVIGNNFWIEKIPGSERFAERFGTESLYGEGSSFTGRLEIYQWGFNSVAKMPFGRGLGSSGMGRRAEKQAVQTFGDSGYIQMFGQFGWMGGILFFGGLGLLWKELGMRWKLGGKLVGLDHVDPFIPATRALLLGALVFLFVGDIFAGFSLIWVFFGRSLNAQSDPLRIVQQKLAENELIQALQSPAGAASPLVENKG